MKRRLLKLSVLLLAGAIVNVAVAWGCISYAMYDKSPRLLRLYSSEPTTADIEWWRANAPSRMVQPNEMQDEMTLPGFEVRTLLGEGHMLPTQQARLAEQSRRYKAGLPFRALAAEWFSYSAAENPSGHGASSKWLIAFDRQSNLGRYVPPLPLRPIWPGFAINTIFYAAIPWVLWFVPGQVKRTLRRRRGLCPACAYPVGTSCVCTECGSVVKSIHNRGQQDQDH